MVGGTNSEVRCVRGEGESSTKVVGLGGVEARRTKETRAFWNEANVGETTRNLWGYRRVDVREYWNDRGVTPPSKTYLF